MLFCAACGRFANWVQVDGFRCPCKGVRRPSGGERDGRGRGGGGVLGRWRRRGRRSEEGEREGEEEVGRNEMGTVQAVQIGVM